MPNCVFTDNEIFTFLEFVRDSDAFRHLDGRVQKNIDVFKRLAQRTNEQMGHGEDESKSGEQWRTKWKNLKKVYLAEKLEASKSG